MGKWRWRSPRPAPNGAGGGGSAVADGYLVALAGNPNTGKSTLFNALTGLRQHTGNWPGKTVARAEGKYTHRGDSFRVIDLPGTYSLLSTSTDERVARDFLLFGRPDVTVIVVDASRLERNLNLVLQVLRITDRCVVCLNLMDEARAHGVVVDVDGLSDELGVPVVATVARRRQGIEDLVKAVARVADGTTVCAPHRFPIDVPGLGSAVEELAEQIRRRFPDATSAEWISLRLLAGDRAVINAWASGEIAAAFSPGRTAPPDPPRYAP